MSPKKLSVRYRTTVYAKQQLRQISDIGGSQDNYAINRVVKVINGSIDDVLHLIGYSFMQLKQINEHLSIRNNVSDSDSDDESEYELSFTLDQINKINNIVNERPVRAYVVNCKDNLYGVIVDKSVARICGQISTVLPKYVPNSQLSSVCQRGIKIGKSGKLEKLVDNNEVKQYINVGYHLIIVGEKGSLFVVPDDVNDDNGHRYDNNLTLVLGHGFVVIDSKSSIEWIRTKQHLRDNRRESTELLPNESIVVSFAGICINGDNAVKIYGTGSVINIGDIQKFVEF